MKLYNILFLALVLGSLISLASAEVQTLGKDYPQNKCVTLLQSCSTCTSVNLTSVSLPNSTVMIIGSYMTKEGTTFSYNFCSTDLLGDYIYNSCGNLTTYIECQPVNFTVGKAFSVGQSITAGILYVFLILIFIGSIYSFIVIPWNNPRTPEGNIVNVDFKKYFKIAMLGVSYICLVGLIYFSWNFAYGILQFTEMANFFYALYRMSFILLFLVLPSLFLVGVFRFVKDMKIYKDLVRGLTVK